MAIVEQDASPISLADRFQQVRSFTDSLVAPLSAEDQCIQSMPDVSPTRWHLAHTSWFFETFFLAAIPGYVSPQPEFEYLFNSYYNSVGIQFPRDQRGLLSRPGTREIREYRDRIDAQMLQQLSAGDLSEEQTRIVDLGLQHEQQHQELILTDIKHVLAQNPLFPAYQEGEWESATSSAVADWIHFDEGVFEIGHAGDGFSFDNESPRHRVFLERFSLAERPVTNGEFLQFVNAGGYQQPEHWLSLGWSAVNRNGWQTPIYWIYRNDAWHEFTLAGLKPLELARPVCHISYFEADAFARWAGARLPTEAEWERAADTQNKEGNFADRLFAAGQIIHPQQAACTGKLTQLFGDVWEWTSSSYAPYPGYQPPTGALGEYNGKFMCNQYVLRGGSVASSQQHLRASYRNFFPPDARWQFSGFRLARSNCTT